MTAKGSLFIMARMIKLAKYIDTVNPRYNGPAYNGFWI